MFNPDYLVPPGEYLKEVMDGFVMGKVRLAQVLEGECSVNSLLAGDTPITPKIARHLEEIFSVPVRVWLGLEREYRKALKVSLKQQPSLNGETSPKSENPICDVGT